MTSATEEIERELADGPLHCWEHANWQALANHVGVCPRRHARAVAVYVAKREAETIERVAKYVEEHVVYAKGAGVAALIREMLLGSGFGA